MRGRLQRNAPDSFVTVGVKHQRIKADKAARWIASGSRAFLQAVWRKDTHRKILPTPTVFYEGQIALKQRKTQMDTSLREPGQVLRT